MIVVFVVVAVVAVRCGVAAMIAVAARIGDSAVAGVNSVHLIQTQSPLLPTHLVSSPPRRRFDHSHTPPPSTPFLLPSFYSKTMHGSLSSLYRCSNSLSSPSSDIFSLHGRPLHGAPRHTPDHLEKERVGME